MSLESHSDSFRDDEANNNNTNNIEDVEKLLQQQHQQLFFPSQKLEFASTSSRASNKTGRWKKFEIIKFEIGVTEVRNFFRTYFKMAYGFAFWIISNIFQLYNFDFCHFEICNF